MLGLELRYVPSAQFLGVYPRHMEVFVHTNPCALMFLETLFMMAKKWEQVKRQSADEWINRPWSVRTMEYYLAIKRREEVTQATTGKSRVVVNGYTMVLNMFTGVCNHFHNLSLEDFNHPEEKPCTSKKSHSISPSPTSPWQPLICFLSALQNFL